MSLRSIRATNIRCLRAHGALDQEIASFRAYRRVVYPDDAGARIDRATSAQPRKDQAMAKQQAESVYRIVDVVGVSDKSWEDAGRHAVETAAGSLRDLRVAEVTQMDMKVENGKVTAFRTRVALSFKYEA